MRYATHTGANGNAIDAVHHTRLNCHSSDNMFDATMPVTVAPQPGSLGVGIALQQALAHTTAGVSSQQVAQYISVS